MQTIIQTIQPGSGSTYPEQLVQVARRFQRGDVEQIKIAALLFEVSGAFEYLIIDRDRLQRELDDRCRQLGRVAGNWPQPAQQPQASNCIDPIHEAWVRSLDDWATSPEGTAELAAMEARWDAEEALHTATEWKSAVEF